MYNVAVAGTGYVGLVAGVCFAEKGSNVICVDVNEEKVKMMQNGISPIYEPRLDELMIRNNKAGRLHYTTDYKKAYKDADFIFIGVGTPEKEDGSANLDYVYEVAKQIAESVERDCVIVVKSTVPIGTNDKVEKLILKNLKNKVKIYVASNPEFLAQGRAVDDTLEPSRIVIGTENNKAKEMLTKLYANFDAPKVFTNRRSAEMIKYASNDFLALKISYMNDIANACEYLGADVEDVALGMSYDDRIGSKFLHAGCGFGGSCFPKDTKALYHLLKDEYNYELKTISAAIEVNVSQKVILYKKLKEKYSSLNGKTVAVLGLTFKKGTDDLREAPSIDVIKLLLNEKVKIRAFDPVGMNNFKKLFPFQIEYCKSSKDALNKADICLIFTEWDEIRTLTAEDFISNMKTPVVFDGRNLYDLQDMKGVEYISIGRK